MSKQQSLKFAISLVSGSDLVLAVRNPCCILSFEISLPYAGQRCNRTVS
jgi:hypothetical protein